MLAALDSRPAEEWPVPDDVEAVQVDTVSGYPEHDGFPTRTEYVIKGTLPRIPDPIHTKLKICRGQEKLASQIDVARGNYEEKEYYVFKEDFTLGTYKWQDYIDIWTNNQGDPKYHPPKEYCDSANELMVELETPKDQANLDGKEVEVKVKVVAQEEISRVEILVDGSIKETFESRPYETKIVINNDGPHTIKAKAYRKDGKQGESGEIRIGTGGVRWDINLITPTPLPSAASTPSPTPESD